MEQMYKTSEMRTLLISIFCTLFVIGANAQNRSSIKLEYKQTIEGNGTEWRVEGVFRPYVDVKDGDILEIGDVELTFIDIHNAHHTMKYSGSNFSDVGIYRSHKYKTGESIILDLIQKPDSQILSYNSPFFFSDVDLDGEEELLITQWRSGAKTSNRYIAYDLDGSVQMKNKPFVDGLEDEFYQWDVINKEVTVIDEIDGTYLFHCSIYSLKIDIPILIREKGNRRNPKI